MALDLARWHNWVALAVMILILGFVLHFVGKMVPPVGNVVRASFGS